MHQLEMHRHQYEEVCDLFEGQVDRVNITSQNPHGHR